MHVYTFFRKDKRGHGTPIASPSYIEAVLAIKEWTSQYKSIYDLRNYHFDDVADCQDYCKKLDIDKCYCLTPRVLTKSEYKKIFGKDIPKEKNVYEHLDELKEEQPTKKVVDKSIQKTPKIYKELASIIKKIANN